MTITNLMANGTDKQTVNIVTSRVEVKINWKNDVIAYRQNWGLSHKLL